MRAHKFAHHVKSRLRNMQGHSFVSKTEKLEFLYCISVNVKYTIFSLFAKENVTKLFAFLRYIIILI